MSNNIASYLKTGLEQLQTREPLTLSEWADKYFYLSKESSSIEGRWKSLPYQVAILNWFGDDDIRVLDWQKCARVGCTKILLAGIGYNAEHKNRNQVVWQPTDGDMQDFVVDEVDTMLRDVPVVGAKLKVPPDKKSPYNTRSKKVFNGSILDLKGGHSARNYRRMTKDVAIYDEADGFERDIDGEGNCFTLGDTRIETSSFPQSRRGSTPKIKGQSLIEQSISEADKVFFRYLPCPDCEELQRLEFANLKWVDDDPETARFICVHCGVEIEYSQYPPMDKAGRWQTIDGHWYCEATDLFYAPDGTVTDRPRHIGVKIWSAYSYFMTWEDIADRWIKATREAKKGNTAKLKTVVNTVLGETWEEKGEKVDADQFSDRLEEYTDKTLPEDVLLITFAADVQGGADARIELEYLGWGLEEETWSIDYVVIPGDPDEQDVWDNLDAELRRTFRRVDGVELSFAGGMVDCGYMSQKVYQYTGPRRKRKIFASMGGPSNKGPLISKPKWVGDKRNRAIQYIINTDEAKTTIMNRLSKPEPGPGYCHFPAHYDDEFFYQITAEEKRLKRKAGVIVGYQWVKTRNRNEALDCRVGNLASFAQLNVPMEILKQRLDAAAERIRLNIPGAGTPRGRRVRSSGLR